MTPTQFIWRAAGSPAPYETNGDRIPTRKTGTHCAVCHAPDPFYAYEDALSTNFWAVRNMGQLFPYKEGSRIRVGARDSIAFCAACVFCAKALALRCCPWFATETEIRFYPSRRYPQDPERAETVKALIAYYGTQEPDALAVLLSPPPPPFVAGWPGYGVDHGGETNLLRAWWPGRTPSDPLIKLQSKHTALYARISHSQERYPLQIDDSLSVVVDVPLWRRLREEALSLMGELRASGVGYTDTREAIRTLDVPPRCPLSLVAQWRKRTAPLAPYAKAVWWRSFFVDLLPMPPAPPKEEAPPKSVSKQSVASKDTPKPQEEPLCQTPKPPTPPPSKTQLSLF